MDKLLKQKIGLNFLKNRRKGNRKKEAGLPVYCPQPSRTSDLDNTDRRALSSSHGATENISICFSSPLLSSCTWCSWLRHRFPPTQQQKQTRGRCCNDCFSMWLSHLLSATPTTVPAAQSRRGTWKQGKILPWGVVPLVSPAQGQHHCEHFGLSCLIVFKNKLNKRNLQRFSRQPRNKCSVKTSPGNKHFWLLELIPFTFKSKLT